MKRILQAIDGVATKPVVGADSMARFLRVVKEAELNQPVTLEDTVDNGDGTKRTNHPDGTYSIQDGGGTTTFDAQGKIIKHDSPSFAGYSQTTDASGKVTQQNYNAGPMSLQKGPQGATASYNLAGQELQTTLKESKTPHKVALPVQMAMQHFQNKETTTIKKTLGISKYLHKVEEELAEQQAHKRQLINQYASTIAERVLMKESKAVKQRLDPKCWKGKHKEGTKIKGGVRVNNCVPNESVMESDSIGTMPTTEYVKGIYAAAAENGMGAPEISAVKKQMVLAPNGEVDIMATMQKAVQVFQSPAWKKMIADLDALVKRAEAQSGLEEHEAGWERHGQGPGMQNYVVDEAPLDFDKDVPMSSTIHSHKGVNPASIETRIMRARGQLKEIAKMADHDDPLMWQHIARLFPELAMNIEQIDHGLKQLGSIRRKGGRNSKNIPQHLDPDVNETVLNTIKPKASTPKAIKPKAKTSTCRAGQTQTGMQIKDGKSVPKCSVTGIKK